MDRNDVAILGPNQGPAPSEPWNSPYRAPFLADPSTFIDLSTVPGETAIGTQLNQEMYMQQGPHNDLIAMRIQFPYLEIVPFPARAKSILCSANVARDLELPDGTVAIVIRGNDDYFVSMNGNADIPTTDNDSQSVYKPEGYMIYVGNVHSMSVIAAQDTIVSVMCYPLQAIRPC